MGFGSYDWSGVLITAGEAVLIVIVTWFIARSVKRMLTKGLGKVSFLQRQGTDGEDLASSLGTIGSLVVWPFGLMALLNLFQLTAVLAPIEGMLSGLLTALPNVLGAGLIFFFVVVLAKISRELMSRPFGHSTLIGSPVASAQRSRPPPISPPRAQTDNWRSRPRAG